MPTVSIRELKARASEILREVERHGTEFTVTRRGRPVARIEPAEEMTVNRPIDGMGGLRGAFPDWPDLEWEDFMEAKRIWEPRDLPNDE